MTTPDTSELLTEKVEKLLDPKINNKGDWITITLPGTGTTYDMPYELFMSMRDTITAFIAAERRSATLEAGSGEAAE